MKIKKRDNMYYKAKFYDNQTFEVKEISDEDAYAKTQGYYLFSENGKTGYFVIRKTKKAAIKALRKVVLERVDELEERLGHLKSIINAIDALDAVKLNNVYTR